MPRKATKPGLFVSADGWVRRVEIDTKSLADYYELIETDIVERTHDKIGGLVVELWCDEEGLFKPNAQVNVGLIHFCHRPIAGHVVIHARSLERVAAHIKRLGFPIAGAE